jgi:hypothetical protein
VKDGVVCEKSMNWSGCWALLKKELCILELEMCRWIWWSFIHLPINRQSTTHQLALYIGHVRWHWMATESSKHCQIESWATIGYEKTTDGSRRCLDRGSHIPGYQRNICQSTTDINWVTRFRYRNRTAAAPSFLFSFWDLNGCLRISSLLWKLRSW